MGERTGLAALGLACAGAALCHIQIAAAQSRSPAGDTAGARGLAGSIVHYEEGPSKAVIYLEQQGSLVTMVPPPVPRANGANGGEKAAAPKTIAPPQTATKAASVDRPPNNGASPLRAPQRQAAAPEAVAIRR
jgi:hypothetical protein